MKPLLLISDGFILKEGFILAQFFEVGMLVLFGLSWPFNILKSYRSRTARGKSVVFELIVVLGYICGLIGKAISGQFMTLPVPFYFADIIMVAIDMALYSRNIRLDRIADKIVPMESDLMDEDAAV